jgi:hypothetical protein
MSVTITWVNSTHRFDNSKIASVGPYQVARVFYDGLRSRTSPPYAIATTLPGITPRPGTSYNTEADAIEAAERMINHWFTRATGS